MKLNHHINDEKQVLGYIYRTLNDAEREMMDQHLSDCPVCRTRVNQVENQKRQIRNGLKAEINGMTVPSELSFSAITPRLQEHQAHRTWSQLASVSPLAIVLLGLFLSAISLWQNLGNLTSITSIQTPTGTFSVLACFTFMFVSLEQFDRSFSIRPRFILTVVLAFFLWIGTFIIGLMNILVITDLVIVGYLGFGGSTEGASVVAILAVLLAVMVYIGIIIGGAEYHYKNIGQPNSWKLFSWTIFIQLFILVLPYFLL